MSLASPWLGRLGKQIPLAFVSCAEAGWPDVQFGDRVEAAATELTLSLVLTLTPALALTPNPIPDQAAAPEWLVRYLAAKRAVEAKLMASSKPAWPKRPLGSAPARFLRLLRARRAALAGSVLPGEGPAHRPPSLRLGCSS